MKGLRRFLLWSLVFVALVVGFDLAMFHVPLDFPGGKQVQVFYRDFRTRLFGLISGERVPAPKSIEQAIERAKAKPSPSPSLPAIPLDKFKDAVEAAQRYIYVDADGSLQFADTLKEIPQAFRESAEPLKE